MFNPLQEVTYAELLAFKLRRHSGMATRQTGDRLTVHFHERPQIKPRWVVRLQRECQILAAPIKEFLGEILERFGYRLCGTGAPRLRSLASRCAVSVAGSFPAGWRPIAFAVGPKYHKSRFLHPSRKPRLANRVDQVHRHKRERGFSPFPEGAAEFGGRRSVDKRIGTGFLVDSLLLARSSRKARTPKGKTAS